MPPLAGRHPAERPDPSPITGTVATDRPADPSTRPAVVGSPQAADLQAILDDLAVPYEYAVWAADQGMVDFGPFLPLTRAIRTLRGMVRAASERP